MTRKPHSWLFPWLSPESEEVWTFIWAICQLTLSESERLGSMAKGYQPWPNRVCGRPSLSPALFRDELRLHRVFPMSQISSLGSATCPITWARQKRPQTLPPSGLSFSSFCRRPACESQRHRPSLLQKASDCLLKPPQLCCVPQENCPQSGGHQTQHLRWGKAVAGPRVGPEIGEILLNFSTGPACVPSNPRVCTGRTVGPTQLNVWKVAIEAAGTSLIRGRHATPGSLSCAWAQSLLEEQEPVWSHEGPSLWILRRDSLSLALLTGKATKGSHCSDRALCKDIGSASAWAGDLVLPRVSLNSKRKTWCWESPASEGPAPPAELLAEPALAPSWGHWVRATKRVPHYDEGPACGQAQVTPAGMLLGCVFPDAAAWSASGISPASPAQRALSRGLWVDVQFPWALAQGSPPWWLVAQGLGPGLGVQLVCPTPSAAPHLHHFGRALWLWHPEPQSQRDLADCGHPCVLLTDLKTPKPGCAGSPRQGSPPRLLSPPARWGWEHGVIWNVASRCFSVSLPRAISLWIDFGLFHRNSLCPSGCVQCASKRGDAPPACPTPRGPSANVWCAPTRPGSAHTTRSQASLCRRVRKRPPGKGCNKQLRLFVVAQCYLFVIYRPPYMCSFLLLLPDTWTL